MATNPCPCGFSGDTQRECRCAPDQVARYLNKVSGPLMDRIDLHLNVPRPNVDVLAGRGSSGGSSAVVRERVVAAENPKIPRSRGWFRALKVARKIADLGGVERIGERHMGEALMSRVNQL